MTQPLPLQMMDAPAAREIPPGWVPTWQPEPDQPETFWGVWIRGRGWLRAQDQKTFAAESRELAEAAAFLYGGGGWHERIDILPFDKSMEHLEPTFLREESARIVARRERAWQARVRGVIKRLTGN